MRRKRDSTGRFATKRKTSMTSTMDHEDDNVYLDGETSSPNLRMAGIIIGISILVLLVVPYLVRFKAPIKNTLFVISTIFDEPKECTCEEIAFSLIRQIIDNEQSDIANVYIKKYNEELKSKKFEEAKNTNREIFIEGKKIALELIKKQEAEKLALRIKKKMEEDALNLKTPPIVNVMRNSSSNGAVDQEQGAG